MILGINNNNKLVITQYMDNLVSKNIKHIYISYNNLYVQKNKHNQNPPWNGTSWKEAWSINHIDLGWCFWCVFQGHICAQGYWNFMLHVQLCHYLGDNGSNRLIGNWCEKKCFALQHWNYAFFYCDEKNLILDNSKDGIWCVLETWCYNLS